MALVTLTTTTGKTYQIGRAPKGGIEFGGRAYRGGQFCPVAALPLAGGAPERPSETERLDRMARRAKARVDALRAEVSRFAGLGDPTATRLAAAQRDLANLSRAAGAARGDVLASLPAADRLARLRKMATANRLSRHVAGRVINPVAR